MSAFGSAGDVFPLIPVILLLRQRGWDVRVAARRSTGLYLRSLGIKTVGLGCGSELGVVDDPKAVSTRFDGWSSWRRTVTRYVLPELRSEVEQLKRVVAEWEPRVVVTSGFASAARIAGNIFGLPVVDLSIYPQHLRLARNDGRFAIQYTRAVASLAGTAVVARVGLPKLAWGSPPDAMLADSALLGDGDCRPKPIGFPYWDGVSGRSADQAAAVRWMRESPTLIVTLGSFLGVPQRGFWVRAAEMVRELGLRALFLGAGPSSAEFHGRSDILSTGFVPLSMLLPSARGVVHHGGVGTTYGSIWSGTSAVVLPQAYDQMHNGRLVETAGLGLLGSLPTLTSDVGAMLDDIEMRDRTRAFRFRLASPDSVSARLVKLIEGYAGR